MYAASVGCRPPASMSVDWPPLSANGCERKFAAPGPGPGGLGPVSAPAVDGPTRTFLKPYTKVGSRDSSDKHVPYSFFLHSPLKWGCLSFDLFHVSRWILQLSILSEVSRKKEKSQAKFGGGFAFMEKGRKFVQWIQTWIFLEYSLSLKIHIEEIDKNKCI